MSATAMLEKLVVQCQPSGRSSIRNIKRKSMIDTIQPSAVPHGWSLSRQCLDFDNFIKERMRFFFHIKFVGGIEVLQVNY